MVLHNDKDKVVLYVAKAKDVTPSAGLGKYYSEADLGARATGSGRIPKRNNTSKIDYEWAPVIIAYVHKRATGQCEMESWTTELFKKANEKVYLVVHH